MSNIIQGIDISQYQGDVDFDAVASGGYSFVICKATEGADYTDPKFAQNMQKLAALNQDGMRLVPGAYHFGRPDNRTGRQGGQTEGQWFAKQLQALAGNITTDFLPPALDYEKYNSAGATSNEQWIEGFVDVVQTETGRQPMIYTGPTIWGYQLDNSREFIDYPLWQIDYTADGATPGAVPSAMPKGGDGPPWPWAFWQWSGGGDFAYAPPVPGIPGSGIADVDRFYGTLDELYTLGQVAESNDSP